MIIHGDCKVIMPMLQNKFDLVIADPPYGGVVDEYWDNATHFDTDRWIKQCVDLLEPHGSIYIFCSIGPKSSSLINVVNIIRRYAILQDVIVWRKQRGRGSRKGWIFVREEIVWATKTSDYVWHPSNSTEEYHETWQKRLGRKYKRATNVWSDIEEVSIAEKRPNMHPCEKPVALFERILRAHKPKTVLDPFSGSGSCHVACTNLGIECVAIEKDAEYFNLSLSR